MDASVVIAWLLDQDHPEWVSAAMDALRGGRTTAVAPALLWLEVGNRLARATEMGDEVALEAMLRVESLGVEIVQIERPLRLRALTLARAHRLTMYDAVYLAVAEAADAPLLTLDGRLDAAATVLGLGRDGGSGRVSEPTAPYLDRPVDGTSIAAIGAALAEIRREYSA